jgi:RNA polymerase sigma-70 factor (ECF subfamily)
MSDDAAQDDAGFGELMRRVRGGDQAAAEELVRRYEVEIRREIRFRLTDRRLRQVVDSVDICQSVLGNFFARAALGEFDLRSPADLQRLLFKMATNRLTDWARREHAARRDKRREVSFDAEAGPAEPAAVELSPSQQVSRAELLAESRKRLSAEELQIVQRRIDGESWDEIARHLGGTAEALRKRHARAMDRLLQELGIV